MHCTFCGVNLDSLHGVLGYEKMSKEFGLIFNYITHTRRLTFERP